MSENVSNEEWSKIFKQYNLDPFVLLDVSPKEEERLNVLLGELFGWVLGYHEHGSRKAMEKAGWDYPTVIPGNGIDADWRKFVRWVKGMKTTFNFSEAFVPEHVRADWKDKDYKKYVKSVIKFLEDNNVILELQKKVPARLVYEYLERELADLEIDLLAENEYIHISGCEFDCNSCFQSEWCADKSEYESHCGDED